MADSVKVNLEENSKYRVAFDLMEKIEGTEDPPELGSEREYYLRLYRQCIESVRHYYPIEDVVSGKRKKVVSNAYGGFN